jgi:hypothetical protein
VHLRKEENQSMSLSHVIFWNKKPGLSRLCLFLMKTNPKQISLGVGSVWESPAMDFYILRFWREKSASP